MSYGLYTYGVIEERFADKSNARLFVGHYTSIGHNVKAYLANGDGHEQSFVTTYPFGLIYTEVFGHTKRKTRNTTGDIRIGSDVWIGENTTIMHGVNIGDGAIIAAGSHIVRDVEPYSIVGGNPAKHIKFRFTPDQIEALLRIRWWNWNKEKVSESMDLLFSPDIDKFIEKYDVQPTKKE